MLDNIFILGQTRHQNDNEWNLDVRDEKIFMIEIAV